MVNVVIPASELLILCLLLIITYFFNVYLLFKSTKFKKEVEKYLFREDIEEEFTLFMENQKRFKKILP